MNDYKELIETLRDEGFGLTANIIEQLVKERDAAVVDLEKISDCGYCKWFRDFGIKVGCVCQEPCNNISGVNTMWEWRGVQEDNDGKID